MEASLPAPLRLLNIYSNTFLPVRLAVPVSSFWKVSPHGSHILCHLCRLSLAVFQLEGSNRSLTHSRIRSSPVSRIVRPENRYSTCCPALRRQPTDWQKQKITIAIMTAKGPQVCQFDILDLCNGQEGRC